MLGLKFGKEVCLRWHRPLINCILFGAGEPSREGDGQQKGCAGCSSGAGAHLRGARVVLSTSLVRGFSAAAASASLWWVASCSHLQTRKHRLGESP